MTYLLALAAALGWWLYVDLLRCKGAREAEIATVMEGVRAGARADGIVDGIAQGHRAGRRAERARVLAHIDRLLTEAPARGQRRAVLEEVRGVVGEVSDGN